MSFAAQTPSQTWETLTFADAPDCRFWVWFKPPQVPQGLALRVPDDVFSRHAQSPFLTLRHLLNCAGVDAGQVAMWSLHGASYQGMQGRNPALDYLIPPPLPDVDPTIVVVLNDVPVSPSPTTAIPSRPVPDAAYDRIEADWNASLQLETQVTAARKKLAATLLRVNSLNRDLNADERRNADNRDNADWQDTRRWLRDVAARLSRYIRDYDIGLTSAAGQRNLFDESYKQFIAPRRPLEGIEQLQRDYETYRKTLHTLLNNMNSAQAAAERDGEQRAQRVLARIAERTRAARTQRS